PSRRRQAARAEARRTSSQPRTHRMNRRRWQRHRRHEAAELNITAFMNLMVILVPFLLITAVFSRLAIIELNLPTSQAAADQVEEPRFQLEITVRSDVIEVGDRNV